VETVKLTFALAFILSGITMYFLAKEFFGKWGGVLSSIFYVWAPYHSVDTYVRGDMGESWAFIWFPLILWSSYRLIQEGKKNTKWIISLGLAWTGLLLSHNLMALMFTPVFAVWCLIFWIKRRDWKKFFQLFFSGLIAFGLAAFFVLPAILEQKYIHIETLTEGYYNYIAHFATIGQLLLSRFWGYGPSIFGPNDGLSFQIGQMHWVLSLIILGLALFAFLKRKKVKINSNILLAVFFAAVFGWVAAFMTHQNSTFIWQRIPLLAIVQFPWRFLSLVVLGFSFVVGSIFIFLPKKPALIIGGFLAFILVAFNWNYFLPQTGHMGALTDAQKFTGVAWNLQRTAGIYDYLPLTAKVNPRDPPDALADIVSGKGQITNSSQGTDWARFNTNFEENAIIRVNIFQFPVWKATIDGKSVQSYIPDTEMWGRIYLNVPKGQHSVYLKLTNTPVRTIGNYLSLLTWIALLSYPLWRRIRGISL
jgi:hypothetical protein